MATTRSYKCPKCNGVFEYLHYPSIDRDPVPRICPLCEFSPGGYQKLPSAPLIGKEQNKLPDASYRKLEEDSIKQAKEAATLAGCSEYDMRALKITNVESTHKEDIINHSEPINNLPPLAVSGGSESKVKATISSKLDTVGVSNPVGIQYVNKYSEYARSTMGQRIKMGNVGTYTGK